VRRVLMVSPHFPPDTSAGAHRVRLLAPYLAAAGWEPTVVTVEPSAYEGRLDPDLAALVPSGLRVVRAPAWPARATRRVGFGDLGLRAFTGLRRTCIDLLTRESFEALFITIYPTYPALLGPMLKRRFGVPFVLDYQDPWVGSWGRDVGSGPGGAPDRRSRLSRALAGWLEPRAVTAADALTAVSARTYEDVLARVPTARPTVCAAIPLGVDAHDLEALRARSRATRPFDPGDGLVHVSYVGTVLPNGLGIVRALLAAAARLRSVSPDAYRCLRLHFVGTGNQRDASTPQRVRPLAEAEGVADIVTEIAPRLDYLDALDVQVTSDALLLLGSTEPHYTPSKVFPALLAGRPMLAVYHPASPVLDLLRDRPHVRIVPVADDPMTAVDALMAGLCWIAQRPSGAPDSLMSDPRVTAASAPALAGELARVFDRVAA
jgi:glycosyltransferase involved in cell wall biosynthesis